MHRIIPGARLEANILINHKEPLNNDLVLMSKITSGRIFATKESDQHGLECFWVEWAFPVGPARHIQIYTKHDLMEGKDPSPPISGRKKK
jgi:hypothetical protein